MSCRSSLSFTAPSSARRSTTTRAGFAWHDAMMPTLADGDVVRRLYEAIADRDFVAAASCFAENVVWHLPGDSPIAGNDTDGRRSATTSRPSWAHCPVAR